LQGIGQDGCHVAQRRKQEKQPGPRQDLLHKTEYIIAGRTSYPLAPAAILYIMEEQKGGAMKRQHAAFALMAMVLLGCSVLTNTFPGGDAGSEETEKPGAISQESTEETGDISQPGITENPDQPPDQPTNAPIPKATNTTCNELAFFLVSTLAKAAKCETIPASGGAGAQPHETYPMHTKVTLTSYLLANRMMQPVITVFSIADYAALLPDIVNADVSDLQALIGGGTAGGDLPVLPVLNAHQLFSAQTTESASSPNMPRHTSRSTTTTCSSHTRG
jgi:hypothetical protein